MIFPNLLSLFQFQLMMAIFLFVHFPLTVVGAIVGRNITSDFKPPCRTNKVPREVRVVSEREAKV